MIKKSVYSIFDTLVEESSKVIGTKEFILKTEKRNFKFSTKFTFLKPPEEYPDHYILIKHESNGLGIQKYKKEKLEILNNWVSKYHRSNKDVSRIEDCYLGVIVGSDKVKPILFSKFEKPTLVAEERRFRFTKGNDVVWIKRYYYEWKGHYYYTEEELLKYLVSEKQTRDEAMLLRLIKNSPIVLKDVDYRKGTKIPFFLYDGVVPCYYFSDQLYFKADVFDKHFIEDGHIETYDNGKPILKKSLSPGFKTGNELYRAYENKVPDIRERVVIYDEKLRGKELDVFEEGDEVEVFKPKEKREVLKGAKGFVSNVDGVFVDVMFMNYFKERFHTNEIKKLN